MKRLAAGFRFGADSRILLGGVEYLLAYISLGGLVLLLVLFLTPTVTVTSALENSTDSASVEVQVDVNPAVSVGIDAAEVDMDALEDGFATQATNLTVSTNSPTGYTLYIKADNDTASLVSARGDEVLPVTGTQFPNDFDANTWGYVVTKEPIGEATKYTGISTNQTKVLRVDEMTTETYNLGFGARTDRTLPVGMYSNNVIVSAVVNPRTITTLTDAIYMQDMTGSSCARTKATNNADTVTPGNEPSKRLIDVRDGKEYWVSKLADQNCWMTQNLALDLEAGQKLTSEDTDLNSKTEWLIPTTTETAVPAVAAIDYNSVRSWNLGEYVLAMPKDSASTCSSEPANGSTNTAANNSLRPNQKFDDLVNGSPRCANFPNVQNWQPTFTAQVNGTWQGKSASLVAADAINKTYDAHYLLGNYYQYNAATASTNEAELAKYSQSYNTELSIVQNSICPKGWKLPFSGRNASSGYQYNQNGSFYHLMTAYGYKEGTLHNLATGGFNMLNGVAGSGNSGISYQNLVSPRISFAAGGTIRLDTGSLWDAGYSGAYFSETINTTQLSGFYLSYNVTSIYPSNNAAILKTYGAPIRCLVR